MHPRSDLALVNGARPGQYINFIPPHINEGFPLYHWSPARNRKQINKLGMRVGMLSLDKVWRAPYSAWATDPKLAWTLSGWFHPEIEEWDLWMTFSDVPSGAELCVDYSPHKEGHYLKEVRIYERIYKRDIWFVGSRKGSKWLGGYDAVV